MAASRFSGQKNNYCIPISISEIGFVFCIYKMQNRKLLENMATVFSAFHNTHIFWPYFSCLSNTLFYTCRQVVDKDEYFCDGKNMACAKQKHFSIFILPSQNTKIVVNAKRKIIFKFFFPP
jgi:hypothetical protein